MGLGLWGEGQLSRHPVPPQGPDPPASRLLPRSLSLPRTFPGQLGLKFSGERPRARGIRGGPAPPRTLPGLPSAAPVGCRARHSARGGGGGGGAAEPRAGGERGPAWDPSFSSSRGGEGPPLTQHAATLPWPREAQACPAGLRARQVPGTPRPLRPGGAGRAPGSWRGGGRAGPGGGSLSAAVWPRRSSPPLLRHLLSAAPKLFRTSSISPGFEAASPPRAPEPGWGSRNPHFVRWARAPANLRLSPRLSLALPPCASGSPRSWFPKSCARGHSKLRLSNGDGEGGGADTQSLPYLAIGKGGLIRTPQFGSALGLESNIVSSREVGTSLQ